MPAATVTQVEAYTPVYWDGDLPPPERLYGKAIHDAKTPAQQRQEATRLFEFLYNSDGDTPVLGVLGLDPIHKTPL
jgi:hypothetical protein